MDVPATMRAARRLRRVSQRELAALAELPLSTVERIEAGRSNPRAGTLDKLLDAIGLELAVCTRQGFLVRVDPERERLVDFDGRHFPPHWEVREVRDYPFDDWWGWWRRDPNIRTTRPTHTYWRPHRDLDANSWDEAT